MVNKKKMLWLCVVLLLLIIPGCGAEEVVSTTESGFTTRFNPNTGTLTVSGEGTLNGLYPVIRPDEYSLEPAEENYTIKKVVLREGIIGLNNSFNGLVALEKISFPSSLKEITGSFAYCDTIEELTIPKSVKTISEGSFNYCPNLSDIRFKGSIELCHGSVFAGLDSLEEITIPDNSVICGVFYACNRLRKITLGANLLCHEGIPEDFSPCSVNFFSNIEGVYRNRTFYMKENGYTDAQWRRINENISGIGDGLAPDDKSTIVMVKD